MPTTQQKYFAFISYNSRDTRWGKCLQRKLEHYRMPATLCSQRGWDRLPINPVFFAPTDIQPGPLSEELKERLRQSRNLIVVCSPNSARSEWVGREIEYFHQLGRGENIHFFIIDGIPHSGDPTTECINPVVEKIGLPEILGANVNEKIFRWSWLNRQRAYVQLISKLLGVEFDSIWRRHRRLLICKAISWIVGAMVVIIAMAAIWLGNQPFDSTVQLRERTEHNSDLPPLGDAVVSLYLDREVLTDTIESEGDAARFIDIPRKYFGKEARMTFSGSDFMPLDTTICLGEAMSLDISRDSTIYGFVRTEIFDFARGVPVPNTTVFIDEYETVSDSSGIVTLSIPLHRQKCRYEVRIPKFNFTDSISMPTNEYSSIGVH